MLKPRTKRPPQWSCLVNNLLVTLQHATRGQFLTLFLVIPFMVELLLHLDRERVILRKFYDDYVGTMLLVLPLWLTFLITCSKACLNMETEKGKEQTPLGFPLISKLRCDLWLTLITFAVILLCSSLLEAPSSETRLWAAFIYIYAVCVVLWKIFEPVFNFITYHRYYYGNDAWRNRINQEHQIIPCLLWQQISQISRNLWLCYLKPALRYMLVVVLICFVVLVASLSILRAIEGPQLKPVALQDIFPYRNTLAFGSTCKATDEDEVLARCQTGFTLNYQPQRHAALKALDLASVYCDLTQDLHFDAQGVLCTFEDRKLQTPAYKQKVQESQEKEWQRVLERVRTFPAALKVNPNLLVLPWQEEPSGRAGESESKLQNSNLKLSLYYPNGILHHSVWLQEMTYEKLQQDRLLTGINTKGNDFKELPKTHTGLLFFLSGKGVQPSSDLDDSQILHKLKEYYGDDLFTKGPGWIVGLSLGP